MSQEEKDLDVNKAFEDLLFAEEIAQESSYEKGYKSGKEQLLKGYHLGYHRASIIAAQLGYYSGVLEHYLQNNDTNCEKAVVIAKKLLEDIRSTFPDHQDDNLDILKAVDNIKLKYAKFCSLAKISPLYPEAEKLEF
nr:PREDICTED: protein ORAOV1 homolog [Linepithema humile]